MNKPKTTLIIPAHNEAENIEPVLKTALQAKDIIDEILVIADACQDQTAAIARKHGVQILERKTSRGKGDAMMAGVKKAQGEIIMFADADLKGLTIEHLKQVLTPVLKNEAVMSIGLRDRLFGLSALIPKIFPMYAIGGERAMTKEFFNQLPIDENMFDFGIETVMNYYAKKNNLKVAYPVLKKLDQVIKEKKWGFWRGLFSRLGLMKQVWRARRAMKRKKL